jgi:hypothetical protein
MIGAASLSAHHGLVVRTVLDPADQPFLNDHRIDGTPVLPGVMGMEAFAEAAVLAAPGHRVLAVEDVSFTAPLKFYRYEPREVTITAVVRPDGHELVAECRLIAERQLPGHDRPRPTVHFSGRVRLGSDAPAAETTELPIDPDGPVADAGQVYSLYFHGPAYQVVGSAWRSGERAVAILADPLPANHRPSDLPLVSTPRLIELCFQIAGLWQAGREDRLALPAGVGGARVIGDPAAVTGQLRAVARQTGPDRFDCMVIDDDGAVVVRLDGYRTVPLPAPVPEAVSAALRIVYRD